MRRAKPAPAGGRERSEAPPSAPVSAWLRPGAAAMDDSHPLVRELEDGLAAAAEALAVGASVSDGVLGHPVSLIHGAADCQATRARGASPAAPTSTRPVTGDTLAPAKWAGDHVVAVWRRDEADRLVCAWQLAPR